MGADEAPVLGADEIVAVTREQACSEIEPLFLDRGGRFVQQQHVGSERMYAVDVIEEGPHSKSACALDESRICGTALKHQVVSGGDLPRQVRVVVLRRLGVPD